MSDHDFDDIEIDGFLESDDDVETLLKEEYSPREPDDEFYSDLQPQVDVREQDPEPPASPDETLIRGKSLVFEDLDPEVELDEEISKGEEVAATHKSDEFDNPALNSIYKASVRERAARERAEMSKRELLDLAADMVDDFFRKNVKTDGIKDDELNRIKFAARRRIANRLAEEE